MRYPVDIPPFRLKGNTQTSRTGLAPDVGDKNVEFMRRRLASPTPSLGHVLLKTLPYQISDIRHFTRTCGPLPSNPKCADMDLRCIIKEQEEVEHVQWRWIPSPRLKKAYCTVEEIQDLKQNDIVDGIRRVPGDGS